MINFDEYKIRYLSLRDNVMEEFYKPVILQSVEYKRMSGYFSGAIIEDLYKELSNRSFEKRYKLKLICSPILSLDDKNAISEGYELKKIIEEQIISDIKELELDSLPYITELIANDVIDIKFVSTKSGEGIFHSKEGIFTDEVGNKIAISGSNNETYAAVHKNFEAFLVLKSNENTGLEAITEIENTFDMIWNDEIEELVQCEITPAITKAFEDTSNKIIQERSGCGSTERKLINRELTLYDYQEEAINKWKQNNFLGLLEMATGTGKTITAIACQEVLQKKVEDIVTFIVAPQIDLVSQWEEELKSLNIEVIKCNSAEPNYRALIRTKLLDKSTFQSPTVIITTTNTFSSKAFQDILKLYLRTEALLICDEVHSFGAEKMRSLYKDLENTFKYRLGVSATPFRRDEGESDKLISFFDKIVFQYSLKDAIENGFLNTYKYIPVVLSFSERELHYYREQLTEKIRTSKSESSILKEVDRLTSSIANASVDKVNVLKDLLDRNRIRDSKIVYCSPGNYNDGSNIHNTRHIKYVAKELGNHGCKLRIIYSEVPVSERTEILEQFRNKELDTLLAIKCLDQGVNLKEVTHAYILSSTDSLTEFIQRRGRILRTSPNKPTSYIYDLVMLPESIEDLYFNPKIEDAYLVNRELRRMKEYNHAAQNQEENLNLILEIENAYGRVLEEMYSNESKRK